MGIMFNGMKREIGLLGEGITHYFNEVNLLIHSLK